MDQLLKITTIPIAFELKVKNAEVKYTAATADFEVSQNDKGNIQVKGRPIRVNMDSFTPVSQLPQRGKIQNTSATSYQQSNYYAPASSGVSFASSAPASDGGQNIGQYLLSSSKSAVDYSSQDSSLQSLLSSGEGDLSIQYQMDKLNFDMKVSQGKFEFVPGDIEFVMTQRPEVKIEYIGDPIYVPPSAAERYLNFKVKA